MILALVIFLWLMKIINKRIYIYSFFCIIILFHYNLKRIWRGFEEDFIFDELKNRFFCFLPTLIFNFILIIIMFFDTFSLKILFKSSSENPKSSSEWPNPLQIDQILFKSTKSSSDFFTKIAIKTDIKPFCFFSKYFEEDFGFFYLKWFYETKFFKKTLHIHDGILYFIVESESKKCSNPLQISGTVDMTMVRRGSKILFEPLRPSSVVEIIVKPFVALGV